MGLQALLQEPKLSEERQQFREQFFSESGYGAEDILALNYVTKVILTKNGGKYQFINDEFVRLAGPALEEEMRL